ncbi:MAG: dTMP kinase [Caldiserica bacterium]|nr:dTMP kinase [Caldisericota bacterium]
MRPLFIVLEGPDAAGKSTQLELLAAELSRRGIDVVTTREPGGTDLGRALRGILLDPRRRIEPLAELFLLLADRRQHVEELIKPALAEGKWVISSRYTLSSLAYQGYGRGIPMETVRRLNEIATGGLSPDYTFLLDVPPEVALERAGETDRFEAEGLAFRARVREAYLQLIKSVPNGYVIDATRPPEEVCRRILAHLPLA